MTTLDGIMRLITELIARVAELEAANRKQPPEISTALPAAGTVPRGKYRGQLHDGVVTKDPAHVCWLAKEGFAEGLGYTAKHVATAQGYMNDQYLAAQTCHNE